MSETTSAAAPVPGAAPSVAEQVLIDLEPSAAAPAAGPTPVADTLAAATEPTPAPQVLAPAGSSLETPSLTSGPELTPAPKPGQALTVAPVPTATTALGVPEATASSEKPPAPTTMAATQTATENSGAEKTSLATPLASGSGSNPEIEELHNALTRKFTEDEWKALKEFRVRELDTPLRFVFS